ncbi:MAG TPA: sulfur carrier protein ThiS [Candidatus Bathyarchaeia archaeon]|uniref:sulfur carrier protein ThiS n=1 Tax=Brevibacillus migulae TaxID=1644114 RepID=UPI00106EEDBF|nr:sulfur carrier protein ThiS [Brevibacillus migulae]HZG14163.1 sulfur carrier protein ThiS [Candidatus Bathyarchaeia archaeon]
MLLRVNGKELHTNEIHTVQELLAHYQLQQKIVVVEKNGDIVDRTLFASTPLADGDRIEIVHFVGGG